MLLPALKSLEILPSVSDSDVKSLIPNHDSNSRFLLSSAAIPRGVEKEVVRLPIINRRAHAIPIRAPPSPRSRRLVLLPAFQHGVSGVPSHYVPLQGALTGMFFDPVTRMYVGDGPPRSTPHRSDRTVPTTLTRDQVNMEAVSEEPVNIDDVVHVQSLEQINSIEDEADERVAKNPQPGQVPFDLSYTPTSVPTRPYEAYWCRCRQIWLTCPHDCPEPPTPAFPTTMPIRPGTELPADWITHRIVVDPSIYRSGIVPKETPAAAASSCAVEGEFGSDILARWFAPGPAGFDIGPMAEVLQSEAADFEVAYDNVVCSANTAGVSVAHFPTIPYTHFSNNALYSPNHGTYLSNLEGQLAVPTPPYDNDPRSGSETEVPTKKNRRNKRTGHRGKADKYLAHAEKTDDTRASADGGNHKVRGEAKEKQPEPRNKVKELSTKEDSGAVSTVEIGKQSQPREKAKELANEKEKADENARLSGVAPGKRSEPKSHPAGPTNPKATTEKDKANLSEVKRGKSSDSRSQADTMMPSETAIPLSFRTNMSIVTTPQEVRAIVESVTAKQPSKIQQTWSAISQSQTPKKPTPAAPLVEKKAKSPPAAADASKKPEKKRSGENEWTEVVSSGTKKAHKSGRRGEMDSGKPSAKGAKGG